MHGHYYKLFYNQKYINIKDKMLKLKKTLEIYKDFKKLFVISESHDLVINSLCNFSFIFVKAFIFAKTF